MTTSGWQVPLADVPVGEELVDDVLAVVRSGWWSMGPRVEEFEQAFAEFTGARHAIAVANGTAALHLALLAVGCGAGDEVVLPSLNFVAAANAIVHTGARARLLRHRRPGRPQPRPGRREAAITPSGRRRSSSLHYGGHPCDMDASLALAERRGLVVIEDAAHAPGATLPRPGVRHARRDRLLQLLLEQEPARRRGRHDRHGRRRARRSVCGCCARTA